MHASPESNATWFDDAKFGLFIHWGLYALRSSIGAEWAINRERIPHEDYDRYRARFNPDRFNTCPVRQPVGGELEWNRFFTDNFRWQCYYTEGSDGTLYLHITRYPQNQRLVLPDFDEIVVIGAWLMSDGVEVRIESGNYLSGHATEKTLLLPHVPGDPDVTTIVLEHQIK
jgi:hypothetical protein